MAKKKKTKLSKRAAKRSAKKSAKKSATKKIRNGNGPQGLKGNGNGGQG